jgi:hypothetical protein
MILPWHLWASTATPPCTYKLRPVIPAPPRFPDVSAQPSDRSRAPANETFFRIPCITSNAGVQLLITLVSQSVVECIIRCNLPGFFNITYVQLCSARLSAVMHYYDGLIHSFRDRVLWGLWGDVTRAMPSGKSIRSSIRVDVTYENFNFKFATLCLQHSYFEVFAMTSFSLVLQCFTPLRLHLAYVTPAAAAVYAAVPLRWMSVNMSVFMVMGLPKSTNHNPKAILKISDGIPTQISFICRRGWSD